MMEHNKKLYTVCYLVSKGKPFYSLSSSPHTSNTLFSNKKTPLCSSTNTSPRKYKLLWLYFVLTHKLLCHWKITVPELWNCTCTYTVLQYCRSMWYVILLEHGDRLYNDSWKFKEIFKRNHYKNIVITVVAVYIKCRLKLKKYPLWFLFEKSERPTWKF